MGKSSYSPKEKFFRWLIFCVLVSMIPVGIGIILDFIRLDFDFCAACEAHLFDFVLMVFAITGSLLEMSMDLERKMDAKTRNKHIGWAIILAGTCLVLFEAFYPKQTLTVEVKTTISIVTAIVCTICIIRGLKILYIDPTKKAKKYSPKKQ